MEFDIIKTIIFYLFAIMAIGFGILTIFSKKIQYSLISAVLVFFCVAGLFFILGAEYNAVVQLSIYGVAIPILFVFAAMFTSRNANKSTYITSQPRFYFSFLFLGILALTIFYLLFIVLSLNSSSHWILEKQTTLINSFQMFKSIAEGFFVNHVWAFELLSVLLLVVIVGLTTLNFIKEGNDE